MISAELLLLWVVYFCIDEGHLYVAVLIPGVVAAVITFVVSIMLIYGIAQRRPHLLLPSLLWQVRMGLDSHWQMTSGFFVNSSR